MQFTRILCIVLIYVVLSGLMGSNYNLPLKLSQHTLRLSV